MKSNGTIIFLCCAVVYAQQSQLTDQSIVTLVSSGVSQAEVMRVIEKAQNFNFDLRPASTDWMLKAGVSEDVIRAMAAKENNVPMAVSSPDADAAPKPARQSEPAKAVIAAAQTTSSPGNNPAGYKLVYDGGSLMGLKTGTGVKLSLDSNQIRFSREGTNLLTLPASTITEISYGQDVHRRVGAAIGLAVVSLGVGALMALTKSKKHFIGLTWDDGGNKGGAAFQADKNDYRGVLAGLEGVTGKKSVNSDAMTVKN